ncbi:RNA-guided endonuclease InsQ/TnpB family protein [Candidatus Oscillochloris fontis]|uniref:RNA-guided endonuclease InsQ/TnpB family protein n=1 Tax=Candidatus Oscillochloris fontis TaxID=2496868 RepID=UPI0013756C3D|nr:RNA-guided endonuclease TnpB family protein [Candidatus Oscillochloris fontis]
MTQTLSTRTVCCKLSLDADAAAALQATAEAFNAAATYCASVAWEERITNKNTLHHIVYVPTRVQYGLGAQLACCARDKAAEAVRAVRAHGSDTCPTFKPDSAIRYDARTYRLMSLDRVSLNTLTGRVMGQLVLGDFQRRYLYDTSWKIGGAELVQRDRQFFLHITQTKANPAPDEPTGFLGVDFGIVNLAADSDGETYSGEDVKRVRERRFRHRQRLQKANTRRARWRLRKNARREARFQRDANHCISKKLVAKAKTERKALALEELSHIRKRTDNGCRRSQRRLRTSWAFRQLRSFVTYKAQQAGVLVIAVDPHNTSRTCAVCGHCEKANRPNQAHFRCLSCGHTAAADTNAAVNIAFRAARQTAYGAAPPLGGGASTSPTASALGI